MPTGVNPPAGASGLQGAYDPTKSYPDPGPTYAGGNGLTDGLRTGNAYRYGNWPSSGSASGTSEAYATACVNAGGAAQQAACLACLNTRGYWLNPAVTDKDVTPAAAVFTANWLRFHPVKWVLLSLAYKRLVNGPLLLSLREAVLGQSGDVGATLLQKMLPQSCAGQGRPLQQKISAIDNVSYTSSGYPLAEMLFNAAWYMGGQTNPWLFPSSSTIPTGYGNTKSGPCVNCRGDFIVLFGDGRGDYRERRLHPGERRHSGLVHRARAVLDPGNGRGGRRRRLPRSRLPSAARGAPSPAPARGRHRPAPATWTWRTTSPPG